MRVCTQVLRGVRGWIRLVPWLSRGQHPFIRPYPPFQVFPSSRQYRSLSSLSSTRNFCNQTQSTTDGGRIRYRTPPSPSGDRRCDRGSCPTVSISTRCWSTMLPKLPRPRQAPGAAAARAADGRAWGEDEAEDAGEGDDRRRRAKLLVLIFAGVGYIYIRFRDFYLLVILNDGMEVWRWVCSGVLNCVGLMVRRSVLRYKLREGRSLRREEGNRSSTGLSVCFRTAARCGLGFFK